MAPRDVNPDFWDDIINYKVNRRGFFKAALVGAGALALTACTNSKTLDDLSAMNQQNTEIDPNNPENLFYEGLSSSLTPVDFYSCNNLAGPGHAPSEAETFEYLKDRNCIPASPDITTVVSQDPTLIALSTIALPASSLDPVVGDELIILGLIAVDAAILAAIAAKNKDKIPTTHSSASHDPKHPNGGPARRIIDTIVTGGVERFCYSAKLLVNNTEIIRWIVTTGVMNAPYMSHLAWFDGNGWGGAYTINSNPRDIESIAATSQYIAEIAAQACPSLPAPTKYK